MGNFNAKEHLIDLKGKEYLPVAWRLVWFREEHPNYAIDTELVSHDAQAKAAVFKAEICDENDRLLSSGYGSETAADFKDYLEKAETKALGRALAALGYGTQFAPELDEMPRIVDAPQECREPEPSQGAPKQREAPKQQDRLTKEQMVMIAEALEGKCPEFKGDKAGLAAKFTELTGYEKLSDVPPSRYNEVLNTCGLPF